MRRFALGLILSVCFVASCGAFLPLAVRLTDRIARAPINEPGAPAFPILVVRGEEAQLLMLADPTSVPPLRAGATYLVPEGKEAAFQQHLNRDPPPWGDSEWVLHVERVSPDRQRIELYLLGDGLSGGVYEATLTTATPLYRKSTGPGFAFVVGPVALAMNLVLWGTIAVVVTVVRRRRRSLT